MAAGARGRGALGAARPNASAPAPLLAAAAVAAAASALGGRRHCWGGAGCRCCGGPGEPHRR
eukprot:1786277-Alexandrium_andersonii.AAC.1